jgi:hypothetical protein
MDTKEQLNVLMFVFCTNTDKNSAVANWEKFQINFFLREFLFLKILSICHRWTLACVSALYEYFSHSPVPLYLSHWLTYSYLYFIDLFFSEFFHERKRFPIFMSVDVCLYVQNTFSPKFVIVLNLALIIVTGNWSTYFECAGCHLRQ